MGTGRLALEGRVDFFPLWVCSLDLGMSMVLARRVSDRRIRSGRIIIITTLAPGHHLSSPCLLRATTISRHVVSFSGRGILSGPRSRISFFVFMYQRFCNSLRLGMGGDGGGFCLASQYLALETGGVYYSLDKADMR